VTDRHSGSQDFPDAASDWGDWLDSGLMTRGGVLKATAAAAAALAASRISLVGDAAAATFANKKKLVVASAGGVYSQQWDQAIYRPFTKATGIAIVHDDSSALLPKLQAQVAAHQPASDLTELVLFDSIQANRAGLLRQMPTALYRQLVKLSHPGWVTKYGICSGGGTTNVIASNTKTVPVAPKTPGEFFDPSKFPGRRAMWADNYVGNVITALLADGVPRTKLFPLDLDRAYKRLSQLKSSINVWYTTGDQQQQILRDNEVDMLLGWDGRLFNLKAENSVGLALSFNGAQSGLRVFCVPKAAPNPDGAWAFTKWFATNPRAQGVVTTLDGYPTPSKREIKFVSPTVAARLWTSPAYVDQVINIDPATFHENLDKLKTRWYSWLQG
jgi:spermidine/putrescine-binding protein